MEYDTSFIANEIMIHLSTITFWIIVGVLLIAYINFYRFHSVASDHHLLPVLKELGNRMRELFLAIVLRAISDLGYDGSVFFVHPENYHEEYILRIVLKALKALSYLFLGIAVHRAHVQFKKFK